MREGLPEVNSREEIPMTVTVKLDISPHPKKDVERALSSAARSLTSAKESIKVIFSEKDAQKVVLQFWMPDKAQYKVVDDIFDEVKMSCWDFYEDIAVLFENDRKRKPRSRRGRL